MVQLLNGREIKLKLLKELKEQLKSVQNIGLVVIQVGEDKASSIYVQQKEKLAKELNYNFRHIKLPEDIEEDTLIDIIHRLNEDDNVNGIIVQMPIPKHLNSKRVQNAISPYKDVDGLTDINVGKLVHGEECLVACTPKGILDLLLAYDIKIEGKNVVIVGRSDLVGKPLFNLMINNNATVTLCHSKTENLQEFTRQADILVVAIGKAQCITKEYIKEGAIVVDVGINRVDDKIVGDVDFDDVKDMCAYITPVPGGVGQMTVAELMCNTHKAYVLKRRLN